MAITAAQHEAVAEEFGYDISDEEIENAIYGTDNLTAEQIASDLDALWAVFSARGGRCVETAERIDQIRILMAVRGVPAS